MGFWYIPLESTIIQNILHGNANLRLLGKKIFVMLNRFIKKLKKIKERCTKKEFYY